VSHPGRHESLAVPLCEPEISRLFSMSTTKLAQQVAPKQQQLHDDITPKVTIVAKASNLNILALFTDAASTVYVIKGRTKKICGSKLGRTQLWVTLRICETGWSY
jgi:hypothetical protein